MGPCCRRSSSCGQQHQQASVSARRADAIVQRGSSQRNSRIRRGRDLAINAHAGKNCAREPLTAAQKKRKMIDEFRIADSSMPHIVSRQHTIEGVFGILPRAQARIPGQNCLLSSPGRLGCGNGPALGTFSVLAATHASLSRVTQLSAFSRLLESSMPRPPAARGAEARAPHTHSGWSALVKDLMSLS
jgi:hypothetical protein